MEIRLKTEDQMSEVVRQLTRQFPEKRIFFLRGDLGSGKTSFVKKFAKYLGSSDEVTSPTFSIIQEYESPRGAIYHMDLYRLDNTSEVEDLGLEEYLEAGNWCFIEWPDILPKWMKEEGLTINIMIEGPEARKIVI
ncbi:MAG TPA: tRNA (adenosine(37)-N6)-threonylcarbamoyltransferase complex ATPase subunit type 1 TsaE [Saprospiraceae bacterium]|nr:tRNA (adenosine(37)-N6)-threonylcarbamoyltransferase complex ATPase subunit type 1 TsaE [Saprospiraceae bacterium]